ncbi:hypothetical protein, variant [Aphanomyces astaci]|uniref:Uncharacterized protein n=1 Tax=Aphanomyces astaci TaxID=112090 RepID=W4H8W0_APHAT|nr:hypothetical protein, variant [Aphanomyces astaci]ETV87986.1 hypothetical protein, variant [Aphanomyces astaci]|eukprot:XP_009822849.1 hypothetical protein, variant [Aphanomyces astaci]
MACMSAAFGQRCRHLTVVPMAQVSPSMTGGRITKWTKDVGDFVSCYDLLYEFEVSGLTDIDEEENVTTKMELESCDEGYLAVVFDPVVPNTCPKIVGGGTPVALLCDTVDEMHDVQDQFKRLGPKMLQNVPDHNVMPWHAYLLEPQRKDNSCCS